MKKSKLKSGAPVYAIQVRHLVTLSVFAIAITDHFYKSSDFEGLLKLKKSDAGTILYDQLRWQGENGEYHDGFFEAATDVVDERNKFYAQAESWVVKNYPYLNQTI